MPLLRAPEYRLDSFAFEDVFQLSMPNCFRHDRHRSAIYTQRVIDVSR
jgi:hypothetical protein